MSEEKIISNEEFFNNFIKENQTEQSRKIAKQQEIVEVLSAKINDLRIAQGRQNDTAAACKAIIGSNAYSKLNPIISSFSDVLSESAAKKDKKIAEIEKKIRKAKKKIKKLERKQERANQLKRFVDTLRNPDSGQSEFVESMKALRQDSIYRATNKLDKIEGKISKAAAKLESNNLNYVDTVKLKTKIKKIETKRDKLVTKIKNLNDLEQELNKLSKTELVDNKVAEMKKTAVETAEKAAVNGDSIENVIDAEAQAAADDIKRLISDTAIKSEKDDEVIAKLNAQIGYDLAAYNDITFETSEMIKSSGFTLQNGHLVKAENTENKNDIKKDSDSTPIENTLGKITGITEEQALNILNAGIALKAGQISADNTLTIFFDKSKTDEVNKIIENTNLKTNHMKR